MWTRWLPWRFVVSRLARSRGFIDPISVLSRLHRFAQPSEVTEPIELLRAGVLFHARGLLNTRAIQHNLDWVWPFWVERQFDPHDTAFIPRAFSATHVNLTHRNWTAVGRPDCHAMPIVDPHGLLTPHYDGWSLDHWLIPEEGEPLLPARHGRVEQRLRTDDGLAVETTATGSAGELTSIAEMVYDEAGQPHARLRITGEAARPGWLALSVRPANPEGVSFVHHVESRDGGRTLRVNDASRIAFDRPADRLRMSRYREGDVLAALPDGQPAERIYCDVGLATAAALFRIEPGAPLTLETHVELDETDGAGHRRRAAALRPFRQRPTWRGTLNGACTAKLPDERSQLLFDAAARYLPLHAPDDVYPGPYTYKRFWFRDAAFILDALLKLGHTERARRIVERFPQRQGARGYFRSQEGEWDSNGAAIWAIDQCRLLGGVAPSDRLVRAVQRGAEWIRRKRTNGHLPAPHAGLLPAGFSAEHLGPNDYYYWDDLWGVAGLRRAANLLRAADRSKQARRAAQEADDLARAIDRSIERTGPYRRAGAVPASPYRRMDSGAIGSIAGGYPLQLWAPDDPRLLATVDHLLTHSMVRGGFFQDMIHSGINAYLTLHLAQVLLRAGDHRFADLMRAVRELASPTGQWPEAIHPATGGGCMGDGQHIWAAAEWALMVRNCFIREEGEALILASGLLPEWLRDDAPLELGPTPTPHGPVTVRVEPGRDRSVVRWDAAWRGAEPRIEVRLPGAERAVAPSGATRLAIEHPQADPAAPEPAEPPR